MPGARRVDAEVHVLLVVAVVHALDDAGRPVQSAEAGADQVVAAVRPGGVLLGPRADRRRGHASFGRGRALDDRLEEPRGRASAHQLVDIAQVQAELVVPDRVHARVVLAAEPPEPVAPLGDEDLAPREGRLLRVLGALLRLRVEPVARLREQVPRHVVLGVADPGVEARPDPAAGVQVVQLLLRRVLGEKIRHGGRDDVRARLELGVQRVQEVVPVARIELPGILAVEGDDRQVVAIALDVPDPVQAADEIACRVDGGHALVVEADHVRKLRVAEDHRHRPALARDALGLVEVLVAVEVALERARENFLIADHPVELCFLGEADHAFAHRHLGWPHAFRPATEHALEQANPELDLALGVLAVREVPLRQLDLRVGAARGVDVADQGQDRVVVGRERELGLAAVGELSVLRNHGADALELRREKERLVVLREVAVLALQLRQPRVGLDPHRVAPGEVEPHLEVADVFARELGIGGPRGELEVARRLLHAQ